MPGDYGDVNVSPSEPLLGEELVPHRGDPAPSTKVEYISKVVAKLQNDELILKRKESRFNARTKVEQKRGKFLFPPT